MKLQRAQEINSNNDILCLLIYNLILSFLIKLLLIASENNTSYVLKMEEVVPLVAFVLFYESTRYYNK